VPKVSSTEPEEHTIRKNARMAEGGEFRDGLTERIERFDREEAGWYADRAEEERRQVLEEFPLEMWSDLPLERYAWVLMRVPCQGAPSVA
jgi:hypothetical protein